MTGFFCVDPHLLESPRFVTAVSIRLYDTLESVLTEWVVRVSGPYDGLHDQGKHSVGIGGVDDLGVHAPLRIRSDGAPACA